MPTAIDYLEDSAETMFDDSASLPDLDQIDQIDERTVIPEESEEDASLVIMSDGAGQVHAPPARIAARFYCDSRTRRKSSAPSSRRNSMSSTHSHASSRSFRRGSTCQSSYVAQHLRRTSIIESRKARLADRALHAEQVRLRAALAKAAPRGDASASEERAMAAQLAREKYLAKVAAACAEEVAKAKQKAQEMKMRKLEEEETLRREMEEKLADADKRRAQYQLNMHARRMRRASSQDKKLDVVVEDADADSDAVTSEKDPVEDAVLDHDTAARRIQRRWRTRRRKAIVNAYLDLNLTLANLRHRTFEETGDLVRENKVIDATAAILTIFTLLHPDATTAQARACTRTFLSAYLIVIHPASVLSKNGAQEQDLIVKAKDIVVLFESAVARLASWNTYTPSPTQQDDLSRAHNTFTSAFDAWRAQDSSALVETMIASFVELDAIWQTVKDDTRGEVAGDYRQGIRDNQVILLSKIRKLAGPDRADLLIKKAIRESRRRHTRKRTTAEVRPRATEPERDESISVTTPISTPSLPALPQETVTSGPEDDESASISLARLFSPIPSNRILTHELAIDREFRIPASTHSDVRDIVNRSLCDSMRRGFEQGMGTLWTVAMAQEIRTKLTHILKPGNSMYNILVETLDTSLIMNQCEQGVFSYDNFFHFMASILPKLCAPFRDEEVKLLASDMESNNDCDTAAMVEKLFRLLHFIDLLSLDYSNFLLMNAAPVLIRESVGYEQRMFASDIVAGTITLARTNRWWRNASVNMLTETDRRDPEQVRNPLDRPSAERIYSRGLVDLAIAQGPLEDADLPETLSLDEERIRTIRQKTMHMTIIGSILLVAKNLLKRDVRGAWKAEASRLWDLLSKEPPASLSSSQSTEELTASLALRAFAVLDSAHNLPPSTKAALQSTTGRIISQAVHQRFTDPVAKVLFARLRSHVMLRVSARSSSERVRAASSATESLASAGLPEFVSQVGEMVETLRRIADVDWASHGTWYQEIAQNAADGGQVNF
ncbi:T-complex protein 11-domain-containing protein [Delphinella strobiligena]|nr:T-complex protein 11-domain-containing protein [Delphinella strobiligena]